MTISSDAYEVRRPWRTVWQVLSGDKLFGALFAVVVVGLLATVLLPQAPAAGASDPVAYSRWEAGAKQREGALYELFTALGLNSVSQVVWWRVALAGLIPIAALRCADRLSRLVDAWRNAHAPTLRDETRMRATLNAPALDDLGARLRRQHYRVGHTIEGGLLADRAPWAEALSLLLHAGLFLAGIGLLLNLALGWSVEGRSVFAGNITPLPNGHTVALAETETAPGRIGLLMQPGDVVLDLERDVAVGAINGARVTLRQITPGYRVSASSADDKPLLIRTSNFVPPTTEVLIIFSQDEPERHLAVPDVRLALAFTADVSLGQSPGQSSNYPVRLRAFAIPSGSLITDTVVQPELVINDAVFRFKSARGAVIDVHYRPGDMLWWPGAALAILGAIGVLIHPMHRIVIRRRGDWTEFYAGGRNVGRTLAQLADPTAELADEPAGTSASGLEQTSS